MPDRRFLHAGQAAVFVESLDDDPTGPDVGPNLAKAVRNVAELFGNLISDATGGPDTTEIRMGITIAEGGSIRISRGLEQANFVVTMQWGSSGAGPGSALGLLGQ